MILDVSSPNKCLNVVRSLSLMLILDFRVHPFEPKGALKSKNDHIIGNIFIFIRFSIRF
jgi:hypothetical protein